jgi:predicted transcriptional regulator
MKRTTISLPDDLAAALVREASRRRVSVSQVAREAIEARLGWDPEEPREIAFAGIFSSSGSIALSEHIDSDEFKKEYADWIEAHAFDRGP